MKIKYLLFSALLILAVFSRDTLAAVNNASYKVKITILTPSDQVDLYDQWNNQPAKNLVLDAVKQVKDLYSQQLNGSTFEPLIGNISSLPIRKNNQSELSSYPSLEILVRSVYLHLQLTYSVFRCE
jgi:hypothetical protein